MNGYKSIAELHLKEPGFTKSACRQFTKHRERIQKFRETVNLKHLYRNELDKAFFPRDAAYFDSKDLAKRTILDKILKDRAYEIDRNRNDGGFQRALASIIYKIFDKKTVSGMSVNWQLDEELHKPVIKNFKRRKIYAKFKENIWEADLVEMESLSSKKKNVKYLLCVKDVFTKYTWVKPLKDKKSKSLLNAFIEIVNESNCKTNKLWVDQVYFTINLCKNG